VLHTQIALQLTEKYDFVPLLISIDSLLDLITIFYTLSFQ
jgi:hypothetical protein